MKKNIGTYVIKDLELAKHTPLHIIYDGSTKNLKNRKDGHKTSFNQACDYPDMPYQPYRYMADKAGLDKNKYKELFEITLVDYMPGSTRSERLLQESINWHKHLEEGQPVLNIQDPFNIIPIKVFDYDTMEFIGDFDTVDAAVRTLNLTNNKGLLRVLAGVWRQTKGYTACRQEEWFEGWTPRTDLRHQKTNSMPIQAVSDSTGELLTFPSIQAGIRYIVDKFNKNSDTVKSAIRRSINGIERSAYGYVWKLLEEEVK